MLLEYFLDWIKIVDFFIDSQVLGHSTFFFVHPLYFFQFYSFCELMDDREDACFTADEDTVLTDIARIFNVKNIKNRLELSAVWDSVTEAYNKATNRTYAKKQLQKRLTNIAYKQRKQEEKLRETETNVTQVV